MMIRLRMLRTRRMAGLMLALLPLALLATPSLAAGTPADMPLTPKAEAEIAEVKEALRAVDTPDKAAAAGYRRPDSDTPTMGQHWTNPRLVQDGRIELEAPEILMFSDIEGRLELVGVAYVIPQPRDAPMPEGFDGEADLWHRHDPGDATSPPVEGLEGLGRAGARRGGIAMAHLWVAPAVHGPFTDHNHWLPFLALGLDVPPRAIKGEVLAEASLALAEHDNSSTIIQWPYAMLDAAAKARVDALRTEIGAIIPDYEAANLAGDVAEIEIILAELGGLWRDIRAEHEQLPAPERKLLDWAYGNMVRGHDHGSGM